VKYALKVKSHTRTSVGELIPDRTIKDIFVCLRPRRTNDLALYKFIYLLILLYLLINCSQLTIDVRHVPGDRHI